MKKCLLSLTLLLVSLFAVQKLSAQSAQEFMDSAKVFYERHEYDHAAGIFHKLAEEGYPEAMFELGLMLKEGVGIPKDEKKALEYLEQAAEKGFKHSFQPLADMYKSLDMMDEALIFYKMAAKDFPENNKTLAFYFFDDENYEEALPYVKKLSKSNDPDGTFLLGVMTYEGFGMSANPKTGIKLLKKAAEMGHPAAVNFLKDIEDEIKENAKDKDDYDTSFEDE